MSTKKKIEKAVYQPKQEESMQVVKSAPLVRVLCDQIKLLDGSFAYKGELVDANDLCPILDLQSYLLKRMVERA